MVAEEIVDLRAKTVHFLHKYPNIGDHKDKELVYDTISDLMKRDDERWA